MQGIIQTDAKPYSFHWIPKNTALLVIDMQNDFCCPGGFGEKLGNDISPTRMIIPAIQQIIQFFRHRSGLVIYTREGHKPDLSDCPPSKLQRSRVQGAGIGDMGPMGRILIRGEYGHDIISELAPLEYEQIIDKPGKGAFYNTDLQTILQSHGIESLILTGVTTHVCVHTTLREANDRGYNCLVISDATAAYDSQDHKSALHMVVQQGGIFGWVTDTVSLIS